VSYEIQLNSHYNCNFSIERLAYSPNTTELGKIMSMVTAGYKNFTLDGFESSNRMETMFKNESYAAVTLAGVQFDDKLRDVANLSSLNDIKISLRYIT
jgi:hypothetical protein